MSYDSQIESAATPSRAGIENPPGCTGPGVESALAAEASARVRIHTLGRFSVAIGGRQMSSEGKAKQRPLALLKALIALGGRSVASSQLWECLWPDSDGDLAVRNLTVTLHRLRHMLGTNASVLQHDGKLTLNDRMCWVDAWNFDRAANAGLCASRERTAGDPAADQIRAALDLYKGHFLARESEESWMLAPRLKFRIKFERLVTALVDRLRDAGVFAEAIDLCLVALERDPLNETLHRKLMCCHLDSGELAEALRAYLRCREALAKGLGVTPSMQTERLYSETMHACAGSRLPALARQAAGVISPAVHGRRERQLPERQITSCGTGCEAVKAAFP
jgi:DNA-binding SARP family transcriptional activator